MRPSSPVKYLHKDKDVAKVLSLKDTVIILKFSASWCGPCKKIVPDYEKLAQKYSQVVFTALDIDELSDLELTQDIRAVPTFIIVKNRRQIGLVEGASISRLESQLKTCIDNIEELEEEKVKSEEEKSKK